MTAMGIIGIILSAAVGIGLVIGVLHALLEDRSKQRMKDYQIMIDYDSLAYASAMTRIMDEVIQKMPNMIQGMYKTLENDEEP